MEPERPQMSPLAVTPAAWFIRNDRICAKVCSLVAVMSLCRFAEFAGASRVAHKSACVSTGTVNGGAGGLPLPFRAPGICRRRGPFEAHAATRYVGGRLSRKHGHIVARPDTQ